MDDFRFLCALIYHLLFRLTGYMHDTVAAEELIQSGASTTNSAFHFVLENAISARTGVQPAHKHRKPAILCYFPSNILHTDVSIVMAAA